MREVHDRIDQLFREVAASGMSRRQMIQRAAVLGISPLALSVAVAQTAAAQGVENPLGIDPEAEIRDKLNRPLPVARGKPIKELFA